MIKIRLARGGRKHNTFYKIVVADASAPRDGAFIEKVGTYNPNTDPYTVSFKPDRILRWLSFGAKPTETVRNLLSKGGIMLARHLMEGVTKGAISKKVAHERFSVWEKMSENRKKRQLNLDSSVSLPDLIDALEEQAVAEPKQ